MEMTAQLSRAFRDVEWEEEKCEAAADAKARAQDRRLLAERQLLAPDAFQDVLLTRPQMNVPRHAPADVPEYVLSLHLSEAWDVFANMAVDYIEATVQRLKLSGSASSHAAVNALLDKITEATTLVEHRDESSKKVAWKFPAKRLQTPPVRARHCDDVESTVVGQCMYFLYKETARRFGGENALENMLSSRRFACSPYAAKMTLASHIQWASLLKAERGVLIEANKLKHAPPKHQTIPRTTPLQQRSVGKNVDELRELLVQPQDDVASQPVDAVPAPSNAIHVESTPKKLQAEEDYDEDRREEDALMPLFTLASFQPKEHEMPLSPVFMQSAVEPRPLPPFELPPPPPLPFSMAPLAESSKRMTMPPSNRALLETLDHLTQDPPFLPVAPAPPPTWLSPQLLPRSLNTPSLELAFDELMPPPPPIALSTHTSLTAMDGANQTVAEPTIMPRVDSTESDVSVVSTPPRVTPMKLLPVKEVSTKKRSLEADDDDDLTQMDPKVMHFPYKLQAILTERKWSHIIKWNEKKCVVDILDSEEFVSKIMPTYFNSKVRKGCFTPMKTFMRQLNYYGFAKDEDGGFLNRDPSIKSVHDLHLLRRYTPDVNARLRKEHRRFQTKRGDKTHSSKRQRTLAARS